ncbi:MAG: phosphate ABC transporter permease PstA [Acholeplasmataceae bacterium]|nr:phosphate ABC transporter permease PstA [Acholeplasmataceae bacterium]
MNKKTQDKLAKTGLWLVGIFLVGILALFIGYMLYKGLPMLTPGFVFGMPSDTEAGGGVGPQLFNTVYILLLSMLFSIFIAIGAAIYLSEYAKDNRLTRFIRLSTESLSTVPSIVLGLFGMTVFVDFLGMGFSILGGALALSLLNLPLLVRVTEEALQNVPQTYREASLALGATKWQTIRKVVLPEAAGGIVTGIMLAGGRAIGESAILIFTAGTTVSRHMADFDLFAGGETLAVHLWYVMGIGLVPDRVEIANGIGALLILVVLIINLLFILLQRKLKTVGNRKN